MSPRSGPHGLSPSTVASFFDSFSNKPLSVLPHARQGRGTGAIGRERVLCPSFHFVKERKAVGPQGPVAAGGLGRPRRAKRSLHRHRGGQGRAPRTLWFPHAVPDLEFCSSIRRGTPAIVAGQGEISRSCSTARHPIEGPRLGWGGDLWFPGRCGPNL